jgi:hypothetical protein
MFHLNRDDFAYRDSRRCLDPGNSGSNLCIIPFPSVTWVPQCFADRPFGLNPGREPALRLVKARKKLMNTRSMNTPHLVAADFPERDWVALKKIEQEEVEGQWQG